MITDRLQAAFNLVNPGVQIPVIIQVPDASLTRARELESYGAYTDYVARYVPHITADVDQAAANQISKSGLAAIQWYDEPTHPTDSPFHATLADIQARIKARLATTKAGAGAVRAHLSASTPFAIDLARDTIVSLEDVRVDTRSKDLFDQGLDGKGVTVAVLDTGIDGSHPMLEGQVVHAESFVPEAAGVDLQGHGTWTSACVAGQPTPYDGKLDQFRGQTLQGMAPGAKLWDGKVLAGDGCLPASTWVRTKAGWKKMSAIRAGDSIYSLNLETRQLEEDRVLSVKTRKATQLYRIECEEGHVILATGNHPFLIESGLDYYWLRADQLTENMNLVGATVDAQHMVPSNYKSLSNRKPQKKGKESKSYKEKYAAPCTECGKLVRLPPSRVKGFRYCSMRCKSDAYKKHNPLPKGNQFVIAHRPWNKGVHHSQETRAKLARAVKRRLAKGWKPWIPPKGTRSSPETEFPSGHEPWNKGLKGSAELRAHVSAATRVAMNEPGVAERQARALRTLASKQVSNLETRLLDALVSMGMVVVHQHPVYDGHKKVSIVDLVIPAKKLAIYVDGEHFHNYPFGKDVDHRIDRKLRELGWNVLRFWSREIVKDLHSVAAKIVEAAHPVVVDPIIKSIKVVRTKLPVYDIEVERNHNFVANGLVVHNSGASSGILKGIEAALDAGVHIISMSLGSLFGAGGQAPDAQAVNAAAKKGVHVVVAAGNSYGWLTIGSPGSAVGAITVGSHSLKAPVPGVVSLFSSKGPTTAGVTKPSISAPGGNLRPTEVILGATARGSVTAKESLDGGWALDAGTSMATPCVAGILAQLVPAGFPKERGLVEEALARGTRARVPVKNNRLGWGPIDAVALRAAIGKPAGPALAVYAGLLRERGAPLAGAALGVAAMAQRLPVDVRALRLPSL